MRFIVLPHCACAPCVHVRTDKQNYNVDYNGNSSNSKKSVLLITQILWVRYGEGGGAIMLHQCQPPRSIN